MRLGDAVSSSRLRTCLVVGGAVGCAAYACILLRRRLHKPGPPPAVQCPFADNTVALLRELHDGPFRFGDPTPVAAAARREALRRIHRQQAHRRRLRRKMRLLFARSQQCPTTTTTTAAEEVRPQTSRRSTLRPMSSTTDTVAHTETSGVADREKEAPLTLPINGARLGTERERVAADESNYEGRFAERHRRIVRRQQRRHARPSLDAADSVKTFVKHARAMLSSPVDGVLGATRSLTSSFAESDAWNGSDAGRRRHGRSGAGVSSASPSFSSAVCSSCTSSESGSMRYYSTSASTSSETTTTSTTTSTSSSFATASSPASCRDDVASVGSAGTQEQQVWNCADLGGPYCPPLRSSSNLSHPTDPTPSPLQRTSASHSHAASTTHTSASPHPPSSTGGGGGHASSHGSKAGATTSTTHPSSAAAVASLPSNNGTHHRHSYPQQQLTCTLESTTTSSHHHIRSSSQSGTYVRTSSYPDGAFNTALSSAGGEAEEPYNFPISTALYGPPLFATEMDVTDALAELRGSAYYSADRQAAGHFGHAGHGGNYSAFSNAGSGNGGNGGGGGGSVLGVASFLGGALTLSTVGHPASVPSSSSHGHAASSTGYPSYFSGSPTNPGAGSPLIAHAHPGKGHHHHSHSRGYRSSVQGGGGSSSLHHLHHSSTTHNASSGYHPRSSSASGSTPFHRGSSRTSLRHSRTGSPSNSQLLPVYTTLPGTGSGGGYNGSLAYPQSGNTAAATNAAPLSRMSSMLHNSMAGHAHAPAMANSFHSIGDVPHRRSTFGFRRWLRRTRRHARRHLHDRRLSLQLRVAAVWAALRKLIATLPVACGRSVRAAAHAVAARSASFAVSLGQLVRSRLRRAVQRLRPPASPSPVQTESAFPHDGDSCAPLSQQGESATASGAAAAAAAAAEGDARKTETAEAESLDANSMEEAINKVVEMLAPSPGRVPTVVVIRAPLGYDVTSDADSLWAALQLDSTSFEEGLVDVVMMEELKTEPLPPAPPAAPAAAAAAEPSSVPPDTSLGQQQHHPQQHQASTPTAPSATRSLPHPLSLDSATDVGYEQQQQQQQRDSGGRTALLHTPPPPEQSRQRSASPRPAPAKKKADLRITFELYPAHIFYSSVIRAAILQEKDLALRRAAAELYGGVADLEDGTGSSGAGGAAPGDVVGGGRCGSPSSPLIFARAASSSGIGASRGGPPSHTGNTSTGHHNVLNSVENFCLTPIAPGHFLRVPQSPKLPGMHHSHSSPLPGFLHHHSTLAGGGPNSSSSNAGGGAVPLAHSGSGLPLMPLPPPSLPLAPTSSTAAGFGVVPSPTSLSPTFTPSLPGAASNVVVRLSASYSFPALPPQIVRSPLQSSQGGGGTGVGGGGGSVLPSVRIAPLAVTGAGAATSASGMAGRSRFPDDRNSAARRFVNRSEVLLYIHVLRTVVADAPMPTALPSCVLSDLGDDDGVGGHSVSELMTSVGSVLHRNATASPNASVRTARPASTTVGGLSGANRLSFDDQAEALGNDGEERTSGYHSHRHRRHRNNEDDDVATDTAASTVDEHEEKVQTLLELRQREVEAPVLLRYRLRICHQGSRSIEALRRTEKYAQDHVHVWQEEAMRMLQAMPPTDEAVVVSAVASGQRLSSLSTPSLMMTSSPVLRPADSATARLPPPVSGYTCGGSSTTAVAATASPPRAVPRSSSRFSLLPSLSVRTAPLNSYHELDREEDRDGGQLHLPAWAMEVLIRRESMRETLIRDLKEKAFRICVIPLPDMRVHCTLPPVVPRYAAAHARGFPLSRTFAEEVLSQQRTLQYILLQREQENQRVIAAQIRRAMRRQERHARRRRERRAREEEQLRQQAERQKGKSLTTRLTSSMNPAMIVSRVASMVKKTTGKETTSLNSTVKVDSDAGPATSGLPPDGAGERPNSAGSQRPQRDTSPAALEATAALWNLEDTITTTATTATTTERDADTGDGGAAAAAAAAPLPFTRQRPTRQETPPQLNGRASEHTLTSPTEHEVHFFGGSSRNSTSLGTPQDAMLTAVLQANVAATLTSNGSQLSSGNTSGAFSGPVSNNASEEPQTRSSRWSSPPTQPIANSAPPTTSLGVTTNSLRSSPAPAPLTWQSPSPPMLSPLSSQANLTPVHAGTTTAAAATATTTGAGPENGGGSRTSPLSSLSATRSSNWTAVHTATNANTNVTPPPPASVATSLQMGAAPSGNGEAAALSVHAHHPHSSCLNLGALDVDDDDVEGEGDEEDGETRRRAGTPPVEGVGKNVCATPQMQPRQLMTPLSRPNSGDGRRLSGGRLHTNAYASAGASSAASSGQVSPLPQKDGQQQQRPHVPSRTLTPADGPDGRTSPANVPFAPSSSSPMGFGATTAGTLDADLPAAATTRGGGSLDVGVTPPVLYFTRPQSSTGMLSTPPLIAQSDTPSSRSALLVPTPVHNGESSGDGGRITSSRNSLTRSPLPQDGLPTCSITSIPPAVPNNSMYGTFDAYYGHSTATPQAVLLRQQAQAAAVAGLTSGVGAAGSSAAAPSLLPAHLHRSPAVSGRTTGPATPSNAATHRTAESGEDKAPPSSHGGAANTPGGAASAANGGGHNQRASTKNAAVAAGAAGSLSQQLQVPRLSLTGPRRSGSGLLPYTYSADSVSSMYGTAHYPLYQYPDDSAVGNAGSSSSVGTSGMAATSRPMLPVPSSGTLGGLGNVASATAIYGSTASVAGSVHGGWSGAGAPRMTDSPIEAADGGGQVGAAAAASVVQTSHMNRLKQYNKLLSDLLGVAGGPMRSGISFYYTYGDATALLYNASIQAPSDEDILELLEQQRWQPPQDPVELAWEAGSPLGLRGTSSPAGVSDSTKPGGNGDASTTATVTTSVATSNSTGGSGVSPQNSGNTFGDSMVSSTSPMPSGPGRVPPTLIGIGESPPAPPPSSTAAAHASSRSDGEQHGSPTSNTSTNRNASSHSGSRGAAPAEAAPPLEDEGCSYLDYGDLPYPEDAMDALEAEQIDAQRTRNKNFYSIFEHLHRAYNDALFDPRETSQRAHSPTAAATTAMSGFTAAAATARQSPPPLGGFTTTASFSGSPGSPHSAKLAHSFSQGVLSAPYRAYAYACAMVRWVGWKVGLAAAPPATATMRGSLSGVCGDEQAGAAAFCGVLSSGSSSASPSASSSHYPYGSQEDSDAERLAKRFPGERIVTFGREWRVASQLDMHNGQYGLSPLQVWMATRYSRRFAGEVYLMDVVAAGSDPYYPAVRVLDEVVAHAVLYYHNHSLRDFTEDLASELGLEYVPQTVWGRRALGLPINETEVHELDGLLYTATRRRQDRRKRQQEGRRRQREQQRQQQQQQAGQRRGPRSHSTASTARNAATQGREATALDKASFVAAEYGNDVDRPQATPTASSHPRAAPQCMDSARLAESAATTPQLHVDSLRLLQNPEGVEAASPAEEAQRPHDAPLKFLPPVTAAECDLVTPLARTSSPTTTALPAYTPDDAKPGRCSPSSDDDARHPRGGRRTSRDPFAGVDEGRWVEMQSYDQEEDEEVFYGATAAAVVGIGSGDINMAPHVYDAVMEREVYDERMLLRELDHLKDFLIENRNVLSSAMLTATGSNALEAVFGVPATVFPFLLCARESVPLVSSIFESLSYHYGAMTYDNFSKMTSDAYHVDRPDVLRHTPRLFRMVNKSRRGCITYEELCGWLARKLSCGNNVQPNAHLLAAVMSLRLPLALVAESREEWGNKRCALRSLSDAEDEEY